jgi:NADH-quinone oxidoreductase subunit L
MTLPLVVLAGAAIVAGVMNLPFSSDLHFLDHWLEPTLVHPAHLTSSASVKWALAVVAVVGGLVGILAAVAVYLKGRYPASKIELPILARGWRYDESITDFMGGPGRKSFDLVAWFDATFVDGAVNGVGRLVRDGGGQLRRLQTGFVRSYAAMVAIGAVALVVWFLTRASF